MAHVGLVDFEQWREATLGVFLSISAASWLAHEDIASRAATDKDSASTMNNPRSLFVLLLALTAGSLRAEINVEFSGVLVTPEKTSLQLLNLATGRSAWIALGQTFGGYTLTAYDKISETATLTKDGVPLRLRLKSSRVVESKTLTTEEIQNIQKAVLNNLRQLSAASDQYFLEKGKNTATYADLVGETKYVRKLESVDGENYETIELKQGVEIVVTTSHGIRVSYAQ